MPDTKTVEKPRKRDDVFYRPLESEGIVVDPKNKKVHSLNITANFIWNLCNGLHSYQDISKKLMDQFAVKETDALKGIEGIITKFKEHSLLTVHD